MTKWLILLGTICAAGYAASSTSKTQELMVALSEDREVAVAVPAGFAFVTGQGEDSPVAVKLTGPDENVSLDMQFLPDPEGRFASARAQKELIFEKFASYVDSSTEKGMQFQELEPRTGVGSYCVFTDQSLVGKTQLPPGEYLHLTTGVKAWPGVLVVFRCFSNDIKSANYQAILAMLRESVQEKLPPLK